MKPVRSRPLHWTRGLLALVIAVAIGFTIAPAAAQDDEAPDTTGVTVLDDTDEAQPGSEIVRDHETSDTVQRIRRELILVGIVAAAALLIYVWHTSPARRLRVAAKRVERATGSEESADQD